MEYGKTQYDAIGGLFEEFTDTAAQREVEVRTILQMIGDIRGKSVLDLACGFGYFGRRLSESGARKVVGVDISEKMIELAREESARLADRVSFYVRDASVMEKIGDFDIVVAAWLFNYASSTESLEDMFKCAANNMSSGSMLVAYTVNPEFSLHNGNFSEYGVDVLSEEKLEKGYRHDALFMTDPPSKFTFYRWSRLDYEKAIKKAGFKSFTWQQPILCQSDVEKHRSGFWDLFRENCLQVGLVCWM